MTLLILLIMRLINCQPGSRQISFLQIQVRLTTFYFNVDCFLVWNNAVWHSRALHNIKKNEQRLMPWVCDITEGSYVKERSNDLIMLCSVHCATSPDSFRHTPWVWSATLRCVLWFEVDFWVGWSRGLLEGGSDIGTTDVYDECPT